MANQQFTIDTETKKPPKIITITELLVPLPYVTLVQPMCGDGGADHAVCVVDNLIFDT